MSEELDLHDYADMLRRRWWLIVMIVMVGCCSAFGYGRYMRTPVYEATAKLIMTNTNNNDSGEPLVSSVIEANLMMLQTYKDIITTPVVMKRTASEHPELGMTAGEMAGKLKVSTSMTSQVLSISARDGSYNRAANLVNAVSAVFVEETIRLYGNRNLKVLYEADAGPDIIGYPVNISLKMVLVMAFVVSLMIAVGICILLQFFDRKIRTEHDVSKILGVDTLMELPLYVDDEKERYRKAARLKLGRAGESYHVPIEK